MLILALTRKGQESFNGQVPQDDQPGPTSSSSSEQQISSSSAAEAIPQVRVQAPSKEIRGKVNAKGARVNETRANDPRNRYRVNFTF